MCSMQNNKVELRLIHDKSSLSKSTVFDCAKSVLNCSLYFFTCI